MVVPLVFHKWESTPKMSSFSPYGSFLTWGTPSYHPCIDGIFPEITHPAIGNPIFREQLFGEKLELLIRCWGLSSHVDVESIWTDAAKASIQPRSGLKE
jgi:hypothetical protein